MTAYAKPLPTITALTQPFWTAAQAGRLVMQRCQSCSTLRCPAAFTCDVCGSTLLDWVQVSGRGTVWSFCEFHRLYFKGFAAELPYAVVLVQLEEGPRLYSNLLGVGFDDMFIGMPVEAVFEPATDAATLVKFRPSL